MSLAHLTAISPDPKPPATLSALARAQWRRYVREFDLDDEHAQFLLGEAMAACDRVLEARASIAKYGAVIVTATGELKTNPSTVGSVNVPSVALLHSESSGDDSVRKKLIALASS